MVPFTFVFALCVACTHRGSPGDDSVPDSAGTDSDSDSGSGEDSDTEPDPDPRIACTAPTQEWVGPTWEDDEYGRWRVVQLPSDTEDQQFAIVYLPEEGLAAYAEGAPAVVVVHPTNEPMTDICVEPTRWIPPDMGIVEVQPIYPGFHCDTATTLPLAEMHGLEAAATARDAARFANGAIETTTGLSLADVVGEPVCNGTIIVASSSRAGPTSANALLLMAEAGDTVVSGYALFEPPTTPELQAIEGGQPANDPDVAVDGDGDGVIWDDARNVDYAVGDCDNDACAFDFSSIQFDPDATLASVFPGTYTSLLPGLFYLDRNRNGEIDLGVTSGTPDVGDDGAYGADDDFVLVGVAALTATYHSLAAIDAAIAAGVVDEAAWPDAIGTREETEAYWTERHLGAILPSALATLPAGTEVAVGFNEQDHAIALPTRPHVVGTYTMMVEAGLTPRLNAPLEAAQCLLTDSELEAWDLGPEPGTPIDETEVEAWGLPSAVHRKDAIPLALVGVVWSVYGPFASCPADP